MEQATEPFSLATLVRKKVEKLRRKEKDMKRTLIPFFALTLLASIASANNGPGRGPEDGYGGDAIVASNGAIP